MSPICAEDCHGGFALLFFTAVALMTARQVAEGNVFSHVCHSVHRLGFPCDHCPHCIRSHYTRARLPVALVPTICKGPRPPALAQALWHRHVHIF